MDKKTPSQTHHISTRTLLWLAKEPLTHFIVLGALIFAAFAMLNPQHTDRRIEVGTADLANMRESAIKQWGKEPDAKQLSDLLQSYVREEVLYREALASGLDKDDVIVRRRLAQKMEFLAHNEVLTPSEAELRDYFNSHPAQYLQGASVDIEQRFFSGDQQAESTLQKAQKARSSLLRGEAVNGDNFMLSGNLAAQNHASLAREFGLPFADAVFALPVGVWSEPIASVHGMHLVRVTHHRAQLPANFDEVRDKLAAEMLNARINAARDSAYARLRARYSVVLPELTANASTTVKP